MSRCHLATVLALLLLASCGSVTEAPDDAAGTAGSGGAPGGSTGAAGAAAGDSGTAGTSGTAGAPGGATGAAGDTAGTTGAASSGGASGSNGAAGAASSGGSSGSSGSSGAAGAPAINVRPQVETKNSGTSPTQAIGVSFRVWNNGADPLPLARLTLRYWYTADATAPAAQTATCSNAIGATLICAYLATSFGSIPPRPSGAADSYVEISFKPSAGSVAASGASSIELAIGWTKNDGTPFVQSNDWSGFASTAFAGNPHATAYVDGQLVAGTEP